MKCVWSKIFITSPNFPCSKSVNDERKHLGESATFPQTLKLVYHHFHRGRRGGWILYSKSGHHSFRPFRFYFTGRDSQKRTWETVLQPHSKGNGSLVFIKRVSVVLIIICPFLTRQASRESLNSEISLSEVRSSITRLGSYRASLSVNNRWK